MGRSNVITDFESKRFSYSLCLFNILMIPWPIHSPPYGCFITTVNTFRHHPSWSVICFISAFDKCLKFVCILIPLLISHKTINPCFSVWMTRSAITALVSFWAYRWVISLKKTVQLPWNKIPIPYLFVFFGAFYPLEKFPVTHWQRKFLFCLLMNASTNILIGHQWRPVYT